MSVLPTALSQQDSLQNCRVPFLSFGGTTHRLSVHLYQLLGTLLNSTPMLVNHTTPSEIAGIDLHYFLQKERTRL